LLSYEPTGEIEAVVLLWSDFSHPTGNVDIGKKVCDCWLLLLTLYVCHCRLVTGVRGGGGGDGWKFVDSIGHGDGVAPPSFKVDLAPVRRPPVDYWNTPEPLFH